MQLIASSPVKKFKCNEGEKITITFEPNPDDSIRLIKYCFKRSCPEADQKEVTGNEISFDATGKTTLQIFFFFIPANEGNSRAICRVFLKSNTGETFEDIPAEESVLPPPKSSLPRKVYIFEVQQ